MTYLTDLHDLPAPDQLPAGAGPDVPSDVKALADALDPKLSPVNKGLIGARPPFGKIGQRYIATDEGNAVYLDIGTAWLVESPFVDAAAGVPSLRTLGGGALQAAAGNDARLSDARAPLDGSVTAAKIADALKPSAGAAGATEALRALGVAAGTAAAGNDGRLTDARVPVAHAASHQEGGADDIGSVPIGGMIAYAGQALPAGTKWDWADGGLIDKTTFATFFGRVQHAYNGGVDPGSNKVRKPDKRGRFLMGADDFGSGAAGRLPNSNRARGQNGGAERVTLGVGETPFHDHGAVTGGQSANHTHEGIGGTGSPAFVGLANGASGNDGFTAVAVGSPYATLYALKSVQGTNFQSAGHTHSVGGQGGSGPHNNLPPYEADNVIVRVA